MNHRVILEINEYPELYVRSNNFLIKLERLKIDGNKIIVEADRTARLRAILNYLLRHLKVHEDLIKWRKI